MSFSTQPVGFEDLVDVSSLIDLYLVNEIMENAEGCMRCVYVYKRDGEKLKFGPVWDFDIQFEGPAVGYYGKDLLCCQYSTLMNKFCNMKVTIIKLWLDTKKKGMLLKICMRFY